MANTTEENYQGFKQFLADELKMPDTRIDCLYKGFDELSKSLGKLDKGYQKNLNRYNLAEIMIKFNELEGWISYDWLKTERGIK